MEHTILDVMKKRSSCRSYTEQPVDRKILEDIANIALSAPSAMNRQPYVLRILDNKEFLDEMNEEGLRIVKKENPNYYELLQTRGGSMFYHAPAMFAVCLKGDSMVDVGIVCEQITLAATAYGLGSVICASVAIPFSKDKGKEWKQRLQLHDGEEVVLGVLVGYAKEMKQPHAIDSSKIMFIE